MKHPVCLLCTLHIHVCMHRTRLSDTVTMAVHPFVCPSACLEYIPPETHFATPKTVIQLVSSCTSH